MDVLVDLCMAVKVATMAKSDFTIVSEAWTIIVQWRRGEGDQDDPTCNRRSPRREERERDHIETNSSLCLAAMSGRGREEEGGGPG